MSLRALRTLHAIARHGSFARAGEVVGLTQSAVSLQIRALEKEFGAQLFDRSRRLPRLTPAGQIVLEKSAEVLALYDQIASALSDEQSLAGRLKLGVIHTALSGVVPDALAALNRSHPRVRVRVTAGMSVGLALQVAAGELDAAVTTEPVRPHPQNLVWRSLYEDHFWLVAPPGHENQSLRELLTALPFIRFDSQAWAGRVIDRELRRMRLEVRDEMVLDSQEVILKMVEKGLGVAVIPLSDDARANLQLTCLTFGEPQLTRQVVLLERQDRPVERLTTAFSDAVTKRARTSGSSASR